MMRYWQLLFLFILFPSIGAANPRIETRVDPREVALGDSIVLLVTVSDVSAPKVSGIRFEASNDYEIIEGSRSQSMTIVNGDPTSIASFTFEVIPKGSLAFGRHKIPGGRIVVNGTEVPFEGPEISLVQHSNKKISPVDFVQLVDNFNPYEGEQVLYRCEIVTNTEIANAVLEETTLNGFFREDFVKDKQVVRRIAGTNTRVFSIREALYPNRSGAMEVPTRGLTAKIKIKSDPAQNWGDMFDDLWSSVFDEYNFQQRRFVGGALTLKVKPLPKRPPNISGYVPVGKTSAKVSVEHSLLKSGESSRLVVSVESEGNLRPLDLTLPPGISNNLKIYPEKPAVDVKVNENRIIQTKTFIFNLIPEYGGQFVIPPIKINYFDPKSATYEVTSAEPIRIIAEGEAPPPDSVEHADGVEERIEIKSTPKIFGEEALRSEISLPRKYFLPFAVFLIVAIYLHVVGQPEKKRSIEQVRNPREDLKLAINKLEKNGVSEADLREILCAIEGVGDERFKESSATIQKALYSNSSIDRERLVALLQSGLKEDA